MKEKFFKYLEDQSLVGFSGYINFLDPENSRLIGTILFSSGKILGVQYGKKESYKSLINLIINVLESGYRAVQEPGLVETKSQKLNISVSHLEKKFSESYELYLKSKELKPPRDLNLLVNPDYIKEAKPLTPSEFSLLSTIVDHNNVEDIYKNSELLDFELTNLLVDLKKKNALKVL